MKQSLANWKDGHKSPMYWWVTFFGSGLLRPAPGTWGSYTALMAGYPLLLTPSNLWIMIALIIVITWLSVTVIDRIEAVAGIHDAPEIVIDEVAGQWVTMLPLFFFDVDLSRLIIAFALFRIFDIIKPWPIKWVDKHVGGGFGVMIDDIIAGIAAGAILWVGLATGFI